MHTPTHAALNFLVLGRDPESPRWPIVAGAILPDSPMFGFFAFEWIVRGESIPRIFEVLYFDPRWQTLFDVFHSIPIFLVLGIVALRRKSRAGIAFAASLLLHSLVDWPTHLEDAHAYFWPLWRTPLRGIVSYWHPGSAMWAIESATIVAALAWISSEKLRRYAGARSEARADRDARSAGY